MLTPWERVYNAKRKKAEVLAQKETQGGFWFQQKQNFKGREAVGASKTPCRSN